MVNYTGPNLSCIYSHDSNGDMWNRLNYNTQWGFRLPLESSSKAARRQTTITLHMRFSATMLDDRVTSIAQRFELSHKDMRFFIQDAWLERLKWCCFQLTCLVLFPIHFLDWKTLASYAPLLTRKEDCWCRKTCRSISCTWPLLCPLLCPVGKDNVSFCFFSL